MIPDLVFALLLVLVAALALYGIIVAALRTAHELNRDSDRRHERTSR